MGIMNALFICATLWVSAGEALLAKPALVPFTRDDGKILLSLDPAGQDRCRTRDSSVTITDENGFVDRKTDITELSESHTDRFGLHWVHVTVDLKRLPLGATRLKVTACGESVITKVVKAKWREGSTFTVDNIRGHLLDASGFSFILFGSYTYGVLTEVERAVPEAEIPFGMNWIGPYLSEENGHSNATWSIILSFLDRCVQIGVYVHYDLHKLATLPDTPTKWDLLQTEVTTVMHHPAVVAYYLADEPGGQGIDPTLLEKAYDFVKGVDPNKPITEVFCCVDPAKYINSFDIGMADPYPIPTSTPFLISLKAKELIATGKPFFIVVQSFGGGEIWEREPTPAEERSMTYVAMLSGAIGIQYFVRSPGEFPYAETSWSECRRLSVEFREMTSAILSGGGRVNVTPSVDPGVLATGWEERVNGTWVVAAVNYINTPLNVSLTTDVNYTGPVSVIFQDRTINMTNGVIHDIITGYGSVVYRFPPIKSTEVSSSNLLANPSFEQVTSASGPDGAYLRAPADPGSTYLTDTRFSVDGLHSLQLTTPTASNGFVVTPFNIGITNGASYELSFWALSREADLKLTFEFSSLTPASATFQTTPEWTKYTTTLKATATSNRIDALNYQLVSAGTVWIDLVQLIPQN